MNLIFSALLFGVVLGAAVTAIGMTLDRRRERSKSKQRRQQKWN